MSLLEKLLVFLSSIELCSIMRPQVQERLTNQIAIDLKAILNTEDIAVIIDAKHLCVSSRGVKDNASATVTSYYSGIFNEPHKITELQNYLKQ